MKIERAAAKARTLEEVARIINEPSKVYKLKVTLDSLWIDKMEEEISRTIAIQEGKSLYSLHLLIQKAFEWDNDHMFSFFLSDTLWDTENEYSADPLGEYVPSGLGDKSKPAAEIEIGDLSLEKGQKFKYLFDYGDKIIHTIEVIDIDRKSDTEKDLPKIVETVGDSPSQYGYSEE